MQNSESTQPLPGIFIGNEIITRRVVNYIEEKYPLLQQAQKNKSIEKNETKSIWYSKDHVETWLNEMNLTNADGMRVYFGAYGDDEGMAPGQLCLLMVLTRTGLSSNIHEDIIYENETGFEDRQNAGIDARSLNDDDPEKSVKPREFNYGSPCPPVC